MTRQPAENAVTYAITDYGIDPRGRTMFQALSGVLQRSLAGHAGTIIAGEKSEPGRAFYGWAHNPQPGMRGLAQLAGRGRATAPATTAMEDATSAGQNLTNPALAMFAARLRRTS